MSENETQKKVYVLDTSVLVHDPEAVEKFGDNIVVIPIWVVEELDRLKKNRDERGSNSRAVSRKLDEYSQSGSLKEGVKTQNDGFIFIDYSGGINFELLPIGLEATNDNRVILVAKHWREEKNYKEVVVVSKDINLRLKANACGISVEDYKSDKCIAGIDELYSGLREIELKAEQMELLEKIYVGKVLNAAAFSESVDLKEFLPNQCCKFNSDNKCALAIYKKESGEFRLVHKPKDFPTKGVRPINLEQAFAYALLTDPEVLLVSLVGKAGTGKTLMSLLAGYEQLGNPYRQILIYRPNIELGQPIGFLPGDIGEKFEPWMKPIFDNLSLIVKKDVKGGVSKGHTKKKGEEEANKNERLNGKTGDFNIIREFMLAGLIDIEPIAFIRGRSLHNKFVIVDEPQNMTPHEIKTIVTRIGEGSKIVLTGDITQIDNPYVDSVSNGLSYVVERLKGQEIFGHIILRKSERSQLAELTANLL